MKPLIVDILAGWDTGSPLPRLCYVTDASGRTKMSQDRGKKYDRAYNYFLNRTRFMDYAGYRKLHNQATLAAAA